jgi:hypothetical protein
LLGKLDLALLLRQVRLRLVERPLRLTHRSLRFFQRSFEIARIHQRNYLACPHHIAFIGEQCRDAASEFRVHVDLVGFKPAISGGDAGWQPYLMLLPPNPANTPARADDQQQDHNCDTRSPPPLWPRRLVNNCRETAALLGGRSPQLDA